MPKGQQTGLALVLGAACLLGAAGAARAQSFTVDIVVDENGNGVISSTESAPTKLPAALQDDPGPGGLSGALTYSLTNPPGLTDGDVLLEEPGGGLSDLIRFNPVETCAADGSLGCLVFYSDNSDGKDSLADIGIPDEFNLNQVVLDESGPRDTTAPSTRQPRGNQALSPEPAAR
jgi:hypothetical protein